MTTCWQCGNVVEVVDRCTNPACGATLSAVCAGLSPLYVVMTAGSNADVTATVHNGGTDDTELAIGIEGRAGTWAMITPDRLAVPAGAERKATLTFSPGADPAQPTALMPYGVTFTSIATGDLATVAFGGLAVNARATP